MRVFRIVATLCRLNGLEFVRDPVAAFFSVVFPVLFLLLFGITDAMRRPFVFTFGVAGASGTSTARALTAELDGHTLVRTRAVGLTEGLEQVRTSRLPALLVFEPDAPDRSTALRAIAPQRWQPMARLALDAAGASLTARVSPGRWYRLEDPPTRVVSDFTFVFPGLIAMALMQLGLFATATPLLRARDRGTLRHLSTTPIPRLALVASQLLPRFALAACQLLLLLGLGRLLFDLESAGSWTALYGATALGALMLIALGYALAGTVPGLESGMAIILLLNFAMLFFGQVFFDLSPVPRLGLVVYGMPLTYLTDLLRQIVIGTDGLLSRRTDTIALLGWTMAAVVVACRRFRFDMEPR